MPAPQLSAAEDAGTSGVWMGDIDGVWIEPVTAQEMMTSFACREPSVLSEHAIVGDTS